jgi:hypothetical protein
MSAINHGGGRRSKNGEVADLPAKSLRRNGSLVFFLALALDPDQFLIRQASEAPKSYHEKEMHYIVWVLARWRYAMEEEESKVPQQGSVRCGW